MDNDAVLEKGLQFSDEVQKAIDKVVDRTDPLDDPNFDVVQFINELFPNEQSLVTIDDVIADFAAKLTDVNEQISISVLGQAKDLTCSNKDVVVGVLDEIETEMGQLLRSIRDIELKAVQSEQSVSQITNDIKQMDCAKRNLTQAITTLNHLHMLVDGIEKINHLIGLKQYSDVLLPLEGIIEVMQNIEKYSSEIEEIGDLSRQVQQIQSRLSVQILSDFREIFEKNIKSSIPFNQLSDACKIVSLLNDNTRSDLISWFLSVQLSEYEHLFRETELIAWLDHIDKRYIWFKKHLMKFEEKLHEIFPKHWNMSELMSVHFCQMTEPSLGKIMRLRHNEIDVKLLLNSLQKTENFELLLNKRFSTNQFSGLIQKCFKPFLYVFIDSLDRDLNSMLERFVSDEKTNIFGQSNDAIQDESQISVAIVLSSCVDLFLSYKKGLSHCGQLDNGEPMLKLMEIYQKYLAEYCNKLLAANLPKIATPVSNLGSNFLQNFSKSLGVGANSTLSLGGKLTQLEIWKICSILITAEYCVETIQQLQEKFVESIDENLQKNVTFCKEADDFHHIITQSINSLVNELETVCDYNLNLMVKIQWHNVHNVGDQSEYVSAILLVLKTVIPIVRQNLNNSRKTFTQFCMQFANSFIAKFIKSIYKCKPISTAGAEQLLLDAHMLKTELSELPSIGLAGHRKAPSNYTKIIVKGMTKAEMVLKIVLAPIEPPLNFVKQFVKLLPDAQISDFQKILDMKNVKKGDQNQLLEQLLRTNQNLLALESSVDATGDHGQQSINVNSGPVRSASTPSSSGDTIRSNSSKMKKLEIMFKKHLQ